MALKLRDATGKAGGLSEVVLHLEITGKPTQGQHSDFFQDAGSPSHPCTLHGVQEKPGCANCKVHTGQK